MPIALVENPFHRLAARLADRFAPREAEKTAGQAIAVATDEVALSPGARMLAAARQLLAVTKDDAYSHIPDIDPDKGIFHADCSELVDYLTGRVEPDALKDLPLDAGHPEPRADNYYAFLHDRPLVKPASPPPAGHWGQVEKPPELAPGDVIAWKNEQYVPGQSSTGHVMLVSDLPRPVTDAGQVVGYDVPVIDSTSHGHGPGDARTAGGKTGLGEGTVYFPTDGSGRATGFSWAPSAAADAPPRPPALAFGRLLG